MNTKLETDKDKLRIWYKNPAASWNEALPIGNGRLGGMIYGYIKREQIQLNQDSIWYGDPIERNNPDAYKHLETIRSLLAKGRIREAEELAVMALSGIPESQRPYQTMGDLFLNFQFNDADMTDYTRELDLERAVVTVRFKHKGVQYQREYFSSEPDQVMVIRLTADQPKAVHVKAMLRRSRFMDEVKAENGRSITMFASCGSEKGIKFCTTLGAVNEGGYVQTIGENLVVNDADAVTLILSAATTFYDEDYTAACRQTYSQAAAQNYSQLIARHLADYQSLFNRVTLNLRSEAFSGKLQSLDTAEQLDRLKENDALDDPWLASLYFQYGRYLLIACSRPGSLPANLQGIWNKDMLPSWDSKYTININTEMNYWPAESCNLSECHLPLFDHLERMIENGRRTASMMYGCRGFVAHHNTDIWGDTAPQDLSISSTYWPMGAAWLALHLWEHYTYTLDANFLERAYPVMKEAALFFLDFLIEDQKGRLVTSPSVSPENTYILESGEQGRLCMGPSMDSQIIEMLFKQCIAAAGILRLDDDLSSELSKVMGRLPKPQTGQYGQILEWSEDYEEAEPGHRHISHLFGLHPGNLFTVRRTPELAQAARKTLERRLAHGGGHTGWSRAWIINMWARLHDGAKAYENLMALLRKSTQINLLDSHPPFQIDGNFGGTAGITEMLLQCHDEAMEFLPALPEQWDKGSVKGLKAKGGFTVDIEWQGGLMKQVTLHAAFDQICAFYADQNIKVSCDTTTMKVEKQDTICRFAAQAGKTYVLTN